MCFITDCFSILWGRLSIRTTLGTSKLLLLFIGGPCLEVDHIIKMGKGSLKGWFSKAGGPYLEVVIKSGLTLCFPV